MHQSPDQAARLVTRIQERMKPQTHVTTVVCPPFVSIAAVKAVVESDLLRIGAQNLNEHDEGPYTGEISGAMLKELVDYVIVGHSERRNYEHETDKRVALKVAAAVRHKLTPILCVGERLHDKHDGHSRRVVVDQLHANLSQITADELDKIIIAYEPVWAISGGDGQGEYASPEIVGDMVAAIRETLEELFGESASSQVEILYGGSSNPDNAKAYLQLEHINGLLSGGASLNYEQFSAMIETAASLSHAR